MSRVALLATVSPLLLCLPAHAEQTRDLDAHQHGHGALNIAIEGDALAMELEVPGFDIVGFEYSAETDADKAAIEEAIAALSKPDGLFALQEAAGCTLVSAEAELHGEDGHDDHDHDGHDHDEHKHEDHAEEDAHAEHEHEHEEHGHDDHGHEGGETHSEFHAEYSMTCTDMTQLTAIDLPYFDLFANAEELEVQLVTDKGATLMEASRENPTLDLSGAF